MSLNDTLKKRKKERRWK